MKTIELETSDIKRIIHLALDADTTDRRTIAKIYEILVGPCTLGEEFDSPFTVSPEDLGVLTPTLLRKVRAIQ